NVDHRLFDLAIDHAHKIERLIELYHHRVDQYKVADRLGAGLDLEGAHRHGGGKSKREDHCLPCVEHGQRGVSSHAGLLVARHRFVVTLGFAPLGAEVFYGLVIEQRVDGLDVGVGVALVHLTAYADTPFGGVIGIDQIERDGDQDHRNVTTVELPH